MDKLELDDVKVGDVVYLPAKIKTIGTERTEIKICCLEVEFDLWVRNDELVKEEKKG